MDGHILHNPTDDHIPKDSRIHSSSMDGHIRDSQIPRKQTDEQ